MSDGKRWRGGRGCTGGRGVGGGGEGARNVNPTCKGLAWCV